MFRPRQKMLRSVSGPNAGDGTAGKGKAVGFPEQEYEHLLWEKVTSLENELYDYQYNMGLLLIERKEWTSKFEQLILALEETKEALKHEHVENRLAIDEVERREEKLRNALGVEKLCVLDLDKALRAMRSEHAEIKVVADSKLAEASALVASVEERSLEVEAKLRAAEAKLAEMSRRSSEMEKKSQEVESRELAIKKERFSLITDGEALEHDLSKRREDQRRWELKLQVEEERILGSQRIINRREQKANEYDKIISQKQKDLDQIEKKIDAANRVLKDKQHNIDLQVSNLIFKKEAGIETLLEENDASLEEKKHMLALEVDKKWKSLDADLRSKLIGVEKKEAELHHMEDEVSEREQALDKRLEKLKEMDEEFELKREVLKEVEEFIRSGGETSGTEKHQAVADKEELLRLKVEIERARAENEEQLLKMQEKKERIRVSEEERSEYLRLQSELEKEIEKCRHQEEVVLKEAGDLKRQKENFEKEWELLDEKRDMMEKEEKNLIKEQENLEKQKLSEEERLRNEKHLLGSNIEEELKALDEAKEAFKASMEQERFAMSQKTESERSDMIQDLEQKRQELEMSIEKTREEMKMQLEESKKLFEEKERDLENINYLREVASREMEETKQERVKIDRERQEVDSSKRHLQEKQIEIRKDIDDLVYLSNRLKGQREQLINEKNRYISFVEKHKTCKNCGETISGFVPADLQFIQEIEENPDILPPASVADNHTKELAIFASDRQNTVTSADGLGSEYPASGGTISWLRKCTSRIFKFSPGKRLKLDASQSPGKGGLPTVERASVEQALRRLGSTVNENEIPSAIAKEAHDANKVHSDTNVKYDGPAEDLAIDEHSIFNSAAQEDYPSSSDWRHAQTSGRRGRPRLYRTRSMKDVVKDARILLGEALQLHIMEPSHVNAETSGHGNGESQVESSLGGIGVSANSLKRAHAQTSQATVSGHEDGDGDVRSDQKRQKVTPLAQTAGEPAEKRYNLRRAKARIRAGKAFSDLNSKNKVGGREGDVASARISGENDGSTNLLQDGAAGSEAHNIDADTRGGDAENMELVDGGEHARRSPSEGDLGLEDDDDEDDEDDDEDDDDWQL